MEAVLALQSVVNAVPAVRPKTLQIGTATQDSVAAKFTVYHNLDYLRDTRRRIAAKDRTPNNFAEIAAMEADLGFNFIRSSSFQAGDGHISVQSDYLRQWCLDHDCSLQSDSIHGIIKDDHFKDINITFTSAVCPFLKQPMPLMMTIMFGCTKEHYYRHFLVVVESLAFPPWDDFKAGFLGMTGDFSDAERLGFVMAIMNFYNISNDDVVVEEVYRFCEVHYDRSPVVPTKYVNDGRAPDTEKAINAAEANFPAGVNVIGALYSTVINTIKHPLSMGINTVDSRSPQAG
ncbi:hypothetical protein BG006_002482, partial [Podila minutissima]